MIQKKKIKTKTLTYENNLRRNIFFVVTEYVIKKKYLVLVHFPVN